MYSEVGMKLKDSHISLWTEFRSVEEERLENRERMELRRKHNFMMI